MIAATSEPNKRLFRDDAQVDHVARTIDSADLTVASPNSFGLAAFCLARAAGGHRATAVELARKFPLLSAEGNDRRSGWETLGHDDASAD